MSLRLKSLLIFTVAITLLFAIVVGLVKVFIERQFDDIERNEMVEMSGAFAAELQGELKVVASLARDWAASSELRDYVAGANPDFIPHQLNEEVLANIQFDFAGIWHGDGTLAWIETRALNLARNDITPEIVLDAIRRARLVPESGAATAAPASGFLLVGTQLALVASVPIAQGNADARAAGTFVAGRLFGRQAIMNLEKFTGFEFTLAPHKPVTDPVAKSTPGVQSATNVRAVSSQTIVATLPIADSRGDIIADIELSSGRPLHLQAGRTTRIFIIALASVGGILLFVVWYLFDANVIHPVRKLADKLALAAAKGQLPSDLGVTGGGELADLAHRVEALARNVAQAEAKYRAIVEDQVDFIFRYLPNGRRTFVNDAFCRYLGRTSQDLVGGDAHQIVADEDVGRVLSVIERLSVAEPVCVLDHRVNIPGGGVAWFRRTDRAIFSADGTLRELQCVARDFTQGHLTRQRLEASETRYRRLFETAADGILLVKRASRLVDDVNPALGRILACSRETTIGRALEAISPFKNPRTLRTLARLLEGDRPDLRAEITLPGPNDANCHLEVTAGIYDAGGETIVQLNFRDISQRKRANEELRQLSGHLLRSQDEERRRIARELHDSTAQTLSALQMAVTQLESHLPASDAARTALAEVRELNDASLREIRTMSYLLHPPLLDEAGLLFALRWYVNGFMTRTEKIVRLDIPETLDRLPPEIETTIFRVVQEGLTNVHRHSGSRRAWIRLALEGNTLTLEIRDEGRGIDALSAHNLDPASRPVVGVGIAGMRERLSQLGGSLVIESSSKGTTLRATVSLDS